MRNLLLNVFIVALMACSNTQNEQASISKNEKKDSTITNVLTTQSNIENARNTALIKTPNNQDSTLVKELATTIIHLLKDKKLSALAEYIHPKRGVLFSPYAYVSEPLNFFNSANYLELIKNDKKYIFGFYDGSGEPIELTFDAYCAKFIYNVDYVNAPQIAYNRFLGFGNSLNNLKEFFPNANFVEYYFPGFENKYDGMDWQTLRLVFEKYDNQFYLIAIVHDQWVI